MIAIQAGDWEAMSLEDSIHISPCHSCRTLPPYGVTPTDLDGHLLFLFVFLLSFIQVAIQVGVLLLECSQHTPHNNFLSHDLPVFLFFFATM